jgi:hypothetical protein
MTKLTLEIPDSLHRTIKSFASANGETIKDFFVKVVTEELKKSAKSLKKKTAKKPVKKLSKYITEEEADEMLKPYLLRMVKRIESGEEELYSEEEFFKKLRED